ncbi:uncharacterized protein UV8b_07537 [Ustilaginoidea virens]|uniref:Uncharacterized protein n=1 Tax=Ustilaginoidea virens TaxID=1159556 RepID=A0A8E5MKP7_USTVR|nr:uncharacterized protein UV8b_07537 [Ustilaginoidea virens]QUC23296.1 hypothetical protein UV8b_07537 [Ustilaginoidea virens]
MARFVDLEQDDGDDASQSPDHLIRHTLQIRLPHLSSSATTRPVPTSSSAVASNPSSIARAFQCYPIIASIVSHIDLNALDALARSCRSVHDGLIQYRSVLVTKTLHCTNEDIPVHSDGILRYRARASNWYYMEDSRSYNSKSSSCARDMVDECRKCSQVICRNCAIKPPAPVALRERHRRLCRTCVNAPLGALNIPRVDASLPFSSEPVQRSLCSCESSGVWLCQTCGRSIRGADNQYQSIWRWRNQYGEVLGGLGTGIGDGDRGVICGREEACLAAREREHEVDCDAQDARDSGTAPWFNEQPVWTTTSTPSPPALGASASPAGSPFGPATPMGVLMEEERHDRTPSPQLGPGYERHEIEGIGGRVKRKLVRMVRVGACVPEWDDEKDFAGRVLAPEVKGSARSWCGWCSRVIPSINDKEHAFAAGCGN